MTTLDEVYRRFGETSEAAQLLETELGNLLLESLAGAEDLIVNKNPARAAELLTEINRATLGQLIRRLNDGSDRHLDEDVTVRALEVRNRLAHSFYREHNLRRNSVDGRKLMLEDLHAMHDVLLDAYKQVMLVSGVDLDALADQQIEMPAGHLPM